MGGSHAAGLVIEKGSVLVVACLLIKRSILVASTSRPEHETRYPCYRLLSAFAVSVRLPSSHVA
jgi:hypothetical protein